MCIFTVKYCQILMYKVPMVESHQYKAKSNLLDLKCRYCYDS